MTTGATSNPVLSNACGLPLLLTTANRLGLPMPWNIDVNAYVAGLSLSSPAEVEAWASYVDQPIRKHETPGGDSTVHTLEATVFDLPLRIVHVQTLAEMVETDQQPDPADVLDDLTCDRYDDPHQWPATSGCAIGDEL